jgi:hypothetical protein
MAWTCNITSFVHKHPRILGRSFSIISKKIPAWYKLDFWLTLEKPFRASSTTLPHAPEIELELCSPTFNAINESFLLHS